MMHRNKESKAKVCMINTMFMNKDKQRKSEYLTNSKEHIKDLIINLKTKLKHKLQIFILRIKSGNNNVVDAVKDLGIVADGVTDNSKLINEFFSDKRNEGKILLFNCVKGEVRVNEGIHVYDHLNIKLNAYETNFVGDCNGAFLTLHKREYI